MSIQSEINRIVGFRNAALAAVAEKGVTVPQGAAIDDLPGLIRSISTGREDHTVPKDVDFVDFDGILLYSYTAAEFLALSELPANPSYPGLVAQGWNWTLADAQAYVQAHGCLVVGQNYTTDTGRTRIYVTIPAIPAASPYLTMTVEVAYCSAANNYKIYWGDGTTTNGQDATNYRAHAHTYSAAGDYVIEIEVLSGTIGLGYPYSNNGIIKMDEKEVTNVTKIEFGNGVTKLGKQPFIYMSALESISWPTTLVDIEQNVDMTCFGQCYRLKAVVFPSGFTGRDRNMFPQGMPALKYIAVPKSCTKLQMVGQYTSLRKFTMYSCEPVNTTSCPVNMLDSYSALTHWVVPGTYESIAKLWVRYTKIAKITVPASVTSIGNLAISNNPFLSEIHMLPTSPPTLSQVISTCFANNASNLVIYVPYSADHSVLNAYQTATNWSTWASKMQEEPQ